MRYCICLGLLLIVTHFTSAGDQLTAEQVIQNWKTAQQERPEKTIRFTRAVIDHAFKTQQALRGEVTFTGEDAGKAVLTPWPDDQSLPHLRPGFSRGTDGNPEMAADRYSWNQESITVHEFDGTMRSSHSRKWRLLWGPAHDLVDETIPPLFPGPVRDSVIVGYDWTITKQEADSVWLKGQHKDDFRPPRETKCCEFVIEFPRWRTRAIREFDVSGNREVVTLIDRRGELDHDAEN